MKTAGLWYERCFVKLAVCEEIVETVDLGCGVGGRSKGRERDDPLTTRTRGPPVPPLLPGQSRDSRTSTLRSLPVVTAHSDHLASGVVAPAVESDCLPQRPTSELGHNIAPPVGLGRLPTFISFPPARGSMLATRMSSTTTAAPPPPGPPRESRSLWSGLARLRAREGSGVELQPPSLELTLWCAYSPTDIFLAFL